MRRASSRGGAAVRFVAAVAPVVIAPLVAHRAEAQDPFSGSVTPSATPADPARSAPSPKAHTQTSSAPAIEPSDPEEAHDEAEPLDLPPSERHANAIGRDEAGRHEAEKPWKDFSFELSGGAGYMGAPIHGATTPFGAGFGGRFGLVAHDFYVGLRVINYLGGTDVTLSDRSLLYGAVVGYGFRTSIADVQLIARPEIGLGNAAVSHTDPANAKVDVVTSASGSSSSSSSDGTVTVNSFYVEPALTLMASGKVVFVAINGSMLVLPSISYGGESQSAMWLSYGARGEIGLRF